MQFVNRSKLQGILAERHILKKDLADDLCITHTCLSLKLKGVRNFNETEIAVLASIFGSSIFFLDSSDTKLGT